MLAKQAIELSFATGLDESVQKELLEANKAVARAQNVVVTKSGALTKRTGLAEYTRDVVGGGALAAGFTVHEYDQSYPVLTDAERLYDWSQTQAKWVDKGKVPDVVVSRTGGVQPPPSAYIYQYDSLVVNGIRITILATPRGDNGGLADDDLNNNYTDVYYQVDDAESGASIQPLTLLAQMFGPAIVGSLAMGATPDGRVTVFGHTTTRNGSNVVTQIRLEARVFNTLSPATAPDVYTIESHNAVLGLQCVAVSRKPRGNQLVIFYRSCAIAEWRIRNFEPATGTAFASVLSPSQNISAAAYFSRNVAIEWDSAASVLWLAFRNDTSTTQSLSVRVLSSAYTLVASDSYLLSALEGEAGSITITLGEQTTGVSRDLWVAAARQIDGDRLAATQTRRIIHIGGFLDVDSGPTCYGVMPYSDPVNRGGRWYQWFQPVTHKKTVAAYRQPLTAIPYVVLCEVVDGVATLRPVANVAPQLVDNVHHARFPHLVQQLDAGRYEIPLAVKKNTSTANLEAVVVDFADARKLASVPFGDVMVLSAGVPSYYDGTQLSEVGFLHPPTIATTVTTWAPGAPGGKVLPGTYSCFVVWRAVDARGNVHVSDISNIETLVIAADSTVQVDLHPLVITARDKGSSSVFSSVRAVLYTTRLNGSTFYETDDGPCSSIAAGLVKSLFFDADRNRLFYTQPGVPGASLFRYAPPALRSIVQHNGALAGVAEDGRTIWFSGLHLAGEGPWFHPAFVAYVDDLSPINALASMDGRLFAFTATGIWTIDGNGFSDNGEGGYGPPTRIAADAGCTNERSVVVTPVGILFESELGIALLSRAGQVSWFGRVVEDTIRAYGTITSAVMVRPLGEVRFTLRGSGVTSAWVTWNYLDNLWTVSIPRSDVGPIVHAAMVQHDGESLWHAIRSDGLLIRDTDYGRDYGAPPVYVPTLVETAWIKIAGLQGFQRIWRVQALLKRISPAGLRISLSYDYDDTPTEARTWTDAEAWAVTEGAFEIHCKRQKCTAIKVRVECLEPVEFTSGGSFEYLGLRLVCGVKTKTPRGAKAR